MNIQNNLIYHFYYIVLPLLRGLALPFSLSLSVF